ncbi:DUF4123 domain-containing protein [Pseudomonas syringae]|uniref:DUF4123 domain-containing protein n=1 Tax=Pseudomonas syringae TaxID=317 RepID=UPI001F4125DB|nr:DUF4123 domain-containing protein [Pseudomonas syringae]MCF5710318.1 DUF4123 domain-containing protein [Pseudomonas syringae]
MLEFEIDRHGLPWSKHAYLLLNAINVPDLRRKICEWEVSEASTMLFLQTRFSGLLDCSPALIQIDGPHDPMLARFLAHARDEWGLLLFSNVDRKTLIHHLRWLMFVDQPSGRSCYLNLSDPPVANALFGLADADHRLFGPIDQLHAADKTTKRWHAHSQRGEAVPPAFTVPYRLSTEQIDALRNVAFRQVVINLDRHLLRFFPDYLPDAPLKSRHEQVLALANTAYDNGFKSEADVFHYANVMGFLATQPDDSHPDIRALLSNTSALTPSQRIEQANWLVVQRTREQGEGAQ